jgi:hypothetical protein
MSTGKRLAATAVVWIGYCYAMNFGATAFERPAIWWLCTALSISEVATVLIWAKRR